MKKNIKLATLYVCFANLTDPVSTIQTASDYVLFLVRSHELDTLKGDKEYKEYKEKLSEAHPGADITAMDAETVRPICGDDTSSYLAYCKAIKDIETELAGLSVNLENYNALTDTDKVMLTLEAHKLVKGITIDKAVVAGLDFERAITSFYAKGSIKLAKEYLRPAFNKAVGNTGTLFTGLILKKSDFTDKDIRAFMSCFVNGAKRPTKKDKDGNVIYGLYDWAFKTDEKAVLKALSDLFAVVTESRLDQIEKVVAEG